MISIRFVLLLALVAVALSHPAKKKEQEARALCVELDKAECKGITVCNWTREKTCKPAIEQFADNGQDQNDEESNEEQNDDSGKPGSGPGPRPGGVKKQERPAEGDEEQQNRGPPGGPPPQGEDQQDEEQDDDEEDDESASNEEEAEERRKR